MKVTKEKVENRQAYITVEMEPAEMEEALSAAYRRLAEKANIPGFRKGKAPKEVLKRHLSEESVLDDALKQLLPQAYEKAVKEQEIEPFAQPDVEVTQTDPLIFKAIVPLRPSVELGGYQSIRLTPDSVETTEDKVDAVLKELRHQQATWETVERPLEFGDLAVLNVDSEVEEKPFIKKLGAQYQLQRDSASPAPGFAEKLVGMKKDEEKEFKLTLPEDYAQSDFAGKEASFKVKVGEIKEENLPELNDELAKLVSTDFTTLEALREEVATTMKQRDEERAKSDFEEKVVTALIEGSQIEFPPVLVELEVNGMLNERARQLQMGGGNMEAYLKSVNKTEEQLREELRPLAAKRITASLVLGKVAETEKIGLSDSDIDTEIENMVKNIAEERRDEMRRFMNTPQTRGSIGHSLMTRKTLERLVEIARTPEEVQGETKEENKK